MSAAAEDILLSALIDVENTPGERAASQTIENAMEYLRTGRITGQNGVAGMWYGWGIEP